MADDKPRVRAIQGCVKDYAWGIRGLDSRVARYALESGAIEGVDPAAPYAELWIGTHHGVRGGRRGWGRAREGLC
jgi:mannose-6-phosphate isomerase